MRSEQHTVKLRSRDESEELEFAMHADEGQKTSEPNEPEGLRIRIDFLDVVPEDLDRIAAVLQEGLSNAGLGKVTVRRIERLSTSPPDSGTVSQTAP